MPKMTASELGSIVKLRVADSLGQTGDQISRDRETATKYYRGDPFGNEQEGRSQMVSRDVAEAVDSLLPSLMRVFFAGDETGKFEPKGPEDEEAAKQATDYCNWVFLQQNEGFKTGYVWLKDALLHRTGIVEVGWDDTERVSRETYRGLTPEEYAILQADESIEIEEEETQTEETAGPDGVSTFAVASYDVVVKRTNKDGRCAVFNIPPEEFFISRGTIDLADALTCGRQYTQTVSELVQEGFDRKRVEAAATAIADTDLTGERAARFLHEDIARRDEGLDQSTRPVLRTDAYLRVDCDGDGIAELRKVTCLGQGYEVFANEEIEDYPFAAISPIIMPHKFHGMSIADQTMDIQLVKSTLVRQMLDNLYVVNAPRMFAQGNVNLDDLLTVRPNGVIRGEAGSALTPIAVPFVAKEAFPMVEYWDTVREQRTGVTRYSQGLDADSLNKTATGISIIQDAAQQRQELIARVCAEGFKRLYKLILRTVTQHQKKEQIVRIRNQWVPIDPRAWKNDYDFTVSVGLGTGNKAQQAAQMVNLLNIQKELVLGGKSNIVSDKNIYNSCAELVKATGLKMIDAFFTDPETVPPPQPQPDPKMIELQAKMQMEGQKAQLQAQQDQAKFAMEREKADQEMAIKREEWQLERDKLLLELQIAERKAAIEMQKAEMDLAIRRASSSEDMDMKREQHGMAMQAMKAKAEERPSA